MLCKMGRFDNHLKYPLLKWQIYDLISTSRTSTGILKFGNASLMAISSIRVSKGNIILRVNKGKIILNYRIVPMSRMYALTTH